MKAGRHTEEAFGFQKKKAEQALAKAKELEAKKMNRGARYVDKLIDGIACKVLQYNY